MPNFVWTYNHAIGGADVWRGHTASPVEREFVANCANGLVAQAMCDWLEATPDVASLPLDMNPYSLVSRR